MKVKFDKILSMFFRFGFRAHRSVGGIFWLIFFGFSDQFQPFWSSKRPEIAYELTSEAAPPKWVTSKYSIPTEDMTIVNAITALIGATAVRSVAPAM